MPWWSGTPQPPVGGITEQPPRCAIVLPSRVALSQCATRDAAWEPEDGTDPFYGFYWWIHPNLGAFTALGAGGQYIFVVPDKQLVIVMTSEPYVTDEFSLEADFFELVPMIMDSIED